MSQLNARIVATAERLFQASGRTKFPTVRRVARLLRCRQSDIKDEEAEGNFCLDGVNFDWCLGDLEVYVTNPPGGESGLNL